MKFPRIWINMKQKAGKMKKSAEKSNDLKAIFKFLGVSAVEGLILNIALMNFGMPLNWYSWLGWGFMLWLIEHRLVKYLRMLRWK